MAWWIQISEMNLHGKLPVCVTCKLFFLALHQEKSDAAVKLLLFNSNLLVKNLQSVMTTELENGKFEPPLSLPPSLPPNTYMQS